MRETKRCIRCKDMKIVDEFKFYADGKRKNVCYGCEKARLIARNKSRPPKVGVCEYCGVGFTAFAGSDGKYRRTCSDNCSYKMRRGGKREYQPVKYTYSPSFDLPLSLQSADMCPMI